MFKGSTLVVGVILVLTSPSGAIAQEPRPRGEMTLGVGGLQGSLPGEPDALFREVAVAFSGTLQSVATQFLDGENRRALYTRLTFKPIEVFVGHPTLGVDGTLDVWQYGGSYIETDSGPRATKPSLLAASMRSESVYFIPVLVVENNIPYLNGKFFMGPSDAIISLDAGRALTVGGAATPWLAAVIARGRTAMSTPGRIPDDATSFLTGIRQTAQVVGR